MDEQWLVEIQKRSASYPPAAREDVSLLVLEVKRLRLENKRIISEENKQDKLRTVELLLSDSLRSLERIVSNIKKHEAEEN